MILLALIALLLGMLHGCGGGGSSTQSASAPPAPPDAPVWTPQNNIEAICCNYAPIVVRGHTLMVYSNSNRAAPTGPGEDGAYWLRQGTLDGVGAPMRVLQTPDGPNAYIRTSGVTVDALGRFYALLYVNAGYDKSNGYTPSWAESPDGITWTWRGEITNFGRWQMSANNLVVTDRADDYRFMAWTDNLGGRKMTGLHSADGLHWAADPTEQWPTELPESPQFFAAVRTPFGFHLIAANDFPAQFHRHLWSCDGKRWRVLEMDTPVVGEKNVNLAYDAGVVHSILMGQHWTFKARAFPC